MLNKKGKFYALSIVGVVAIVAIVGLVLMLNGGNNATGAVPADVFDSSGVAVGQVDTSETNCFETRNGVVCPGAGKDIVSGCAKSCFDYYGYSEVACTQVCVSTAKGAKERGAPVHGCYIDRDHDGISDTFIFYGLDAGGSTAIRQSAISYCVITQRDHPCGDPRVFCTDARSQQMSTGHNMIPFNGGSGRTGYCDCHNEYTNQPQCESAGYRWCSEGVDCMCAPPDV